MSMTLYVILSLSDVPDTNSLNEKSTLLKTPIVFSENIDLKTHSGFLPVKLKGESSGVETYFSAYSEFIEFFPNFDLSQYNEPVVITFRWGGDINEMIVALNTAYLLGHDVVSTVFEPEGGMFLTNEQVKEGADAILNNGI
ncbi:MAG: hypothetical protein Alis3KO_41140 [Aliiglaciecola sp.]